MSSVARNYPQFLSKIQKLFRRYSTLFPDNCQRLLLEGTGIIRLGTAQLHDACRAVPFLVVLLKSEGIF
jgi:hypothetical protein